MPPYTMTGRQMTAREMARDFDIEPERPDLPASADSVPCRLLAENTDEYLFAHVLLGHGVEVDAGDEVQLEGPRVELAFGERLYERRSAKVRRANPLRRWWTRFIAVFEITHLYEVSFSGRKKL
ncbi:MAG: hypothetical protein AAGF15_04460 [Pseudomonadota bacterium]